MPPPCGLGKVSKKGIPPSAFGCSMVNFMCGSMEFRYFNKLSQFPLGIMLNTSSTYLKRPESQQKANPHGQIPGLQLQPPCIGQNIMEKQDPLIHPETGNEIQKHFYISVPYFPGLSESFKKIFKYTPVQVCFKGVNTLKSILMHPKDRISNDQKKDLVYHWECKADGCTSSYIGETSRALGERVKEHSKATTSAILKHCKDFHHPLPSIDDCNIIDKEPSQVTREAKEAIHIRRLDPSLNRNIGKMSIPQCFDNLLGAKPKHPRVGELSAAPLPVEEVAPPLQIPGLNLTQFNNIGNFRPNVAIHIPKRSTRACRAKNLFN